MSRDKARGLVVGVAVAVCALALLTPLTLNWISAHAARGKLQALADTLALSTLLSDGDDDDAVLETAMAAIGPRTQDLSPTLRRYRVDGLRTSEVVIACRYTPPIPFLYTDAIDTVEVTGRAITWQ
ncbi:hypothetical protein [Hoeflea marina]|nr:hypothetical protein [Hoeflea marina]